MLDAWLWARKPKDQPDVRKACAGSGLRDRRRSGGNRARYPAGLCGGSRGDLRALIDAAARRGTPADWLIRIPAQPQDHHGELWDRLAQGEPHWGGGIHPAGRPDRPARRVRQTLYRQSGDPAGASRSTGGDRNRDPGPGRTAPTGQPALVWRLLTNRPADTLGMWYSSLIGIEDAG